MPKTMIIGEKVVRFVHCHQPLTTFMAYIPGKGDACLKCFAEFAQEEENKQTTKSNK